MPLQKNREQFSCVLYAAMSTTFYLPRRLSDNFKLYTEDELLAASSFVVVLAEPGGGKTELMGSLKGKRYPAGDRRI